MSKETANKLRVTQLLEATHGQEWQRFDPGFTGRIQKVLTDTLSGEKFPLRTTSKPPYPLEAHAITSFCFFDGKLKRVLAGEHLGDDLMKELMIESSSNLHQWLQMRKTLPRQHYNVITNLVGSTRQLNEEEFISRSLRKEDMESLLTTLSPILETLAKHLPTTDEDFRVEVAAGLAMPFSGDPKEVLAMPPSDRRVANVITSFCFRNTSLESIHGGDLPETEESLSKVKKEADSNLKNWLIMMDRIGTTTLYRGIVHQYWRNYCSKWVE